jgi:hypothetical protein
MIITGGHHQHARPPPGQVIRRHLAGTPVILRYLILNALLPGASSLRRRGPDTEPGLASPAAYAGTGREAAASTAMEHNGRRLPHNGRIADSGRLTAVPDGAGWCVQSSRIWAGGRPVVDYDAVSGPMVGLAMFIIGDLAKARAGAFASSVRRRVGV